MLQIWSWLRNKLSSKQINLDHILSKHPELMIQLIYCSIDWQFIGVLGRLSLQNNYFSFFWVLIALNFYSVPLIVDPIGRRKAFDLKSWDTNCRSIGPRISIIKRKISFSFVSKFRRKWLSFWSLIENNCLFLSKTIEWKSILMLTIRI